MEFKYAIVEGGIDEVFDERGNTVLKMAMTSWNDRPAKLELRKWVMGTDGELSPNKGFAFLTEEGPTELVHSLIKNGYGNKSIIMDLLKDRPDEEVKDAEESDFYYDPVELLGE